MAPAPHMYPSCTAVPIYLCSSLAASPAGILRQRSKHTCAPIHQMPEGTSKLRKLWHDGHSLSLQVCCRAQTVFHTLHYSRRTLAKLVKALPLCVSVCGISAAHNITVRARRISGGP